MDIFKNLQIEMAIKELKANLPSMIEFGKLAAKQHKAYYDSLVKEGFTENQAIEIVKKHGLTYGGIQSE